MNWKIVSGTIDGVIYVNMSNVKILKTGEEQGCYCIYLDSEVIPFRLKDERDKMIAELTGFS